MVERRAYSGVRDDDVAAARGRRDDASLVDAEDGEAVGGVSATYLVDCLLEACHCVIMIGMRDYSIWIMRKTPLLHTDYTISFLILDLTSLLNIDCKGTHITQIDSSNKHATPSLRSQ